MSQADFNLAIVAGGFLIIFLMAALAVQLYVEWEEKKNDHR